MNITTDYPLTVRVANSTEWYTKSLALRTVRPVILTGSSLATGKSLYSFGCPDAIQTGTPIAGGVTTWLTASDALNYILTRDGANEVKINLADLSVASTTASSDDIKTITATASYALTGTTLTKANSVGTQTVTLANVSSSTGAELTLSDDETILVITGPATNPHIVNAADLSIARYYTTVFSRSASVSYGNAKFALGSDSTGAGTYNLATGAQILSLSQRQTPVYNTAGTVLVVSNASTDAVNKLEVYSVATGLVTKTISLPATVTAVRYTSDDSVLVVGLASRLNPIKMFNTADWSEVSSYRDIANVEFQPTKSLLIVPKRTAPGTEDFEYYCPSRMSALYKRNDLLFGNQSYGMTGSSGFWEYPAYASQIIDTWSLSGYATKVLSASLPMGWSGYTGWGNPELGAGSPHVAAAAAYFANTSITSIPITTGVNRQRFLSVTIDVTGYRKLIFDCDLNFASYGGTGVNRNPVAVFVNENASGAQLYTYRTPFGSASQFRTHTVDVSGYTGVITFNIDIAAYNDGFWPGGAFGGGGNTSVGPAYAYLTYMRLVK